MKILQITDPHLYGGASGALRGVVTDASLRCVLDEAYANVPDFAAVLVTGDLVQDDPSGYLRFCSMFASSRKPVLCIPGNHDEPAIMRRSLADAPFQMCGTYAAAGWQFVMLDSCDPGHVGGRLTAQELERLDRALAGSPAHAMVCLHHHPIAMGSRWIDSIGLANAEEFWRVIDAHRHVRAVVWGHVHQEYEGMREGVRLFATPSTGAQFLPYSDRYAVDTRPPAYRLFHLHADGRIDSEVRWVEAPGVHQAASGTR
ncbi:MAG TPA: metallophosphoesterase [Steroidobacteraceae bacterium]|jgi:Icc protein|nr:metallophosphoesterase [Steroidobacteraceae bacterium]